MFAARVVEAIARGKDGPEPNGALRAAEREPLRLPDRPGWSSDDSQPPPVAKRREALQRAMTAQAGVVRDAGSLARAGAAAAALLAGPDVSDREGRELRNLAEVGRALALAASVREETRGCHTRTDFPQTAPALAHRLVIA